MKLLHNQLQKIAPLFEKGGKFEKFYPLFEAGESFLFTPGTPTQSGAHVRDGADLKRIMMTVVYALVPATLFTFWNTGIQELVATGISTSEISPLKAIAKGAWSFLPIYAVTLAIGGAFETIFALIRKHEINEGFLVSSLLFPLVMPPSIPLWQVALGITFGIVIGKEIFGGTGMNILNPALLGRLFLFIAYPGQISGDDVWVAGRENWVDGFSGATPLANFYLEGNAATTTLNWWECFIGTMPGSMGETSTLACLIGAAILIISKVGSWQIMLATFLGMFGMAELLNSLAPIVLNDLTEAQIAAHYMSIEWHWHLVVGGFAFGTVFMATDPVSAAQTNRGKWIYGALIGVLTVLVRVVNPAYPEGMMLAIIFMNVFAPTIDYYVVKANIKRREKRLGIQ